MNGGTIQPTSPKSIQLQSDSSNIKRDEHKKKSFTSVQGYALHEILGKGSFGQVFKATRNGKNYAIKMIDKPLIRKKNLQKYVNNEVRVMRELKNPNTVRLYEAFEDKDILYLVMEYCNQGTLFNYILKNKPLEKECIRIFAQIMRGFIEIHEKQYLHRDLKPSNIFIKDGIFKIADFGLAKPKAIGSSYCGTSYFMAPEILQKKIHDYKVDLWSMGVILFFMIFCEYPFKNQAKLLDEIQSKTIPFFDPYKCLKNPKPIVCSSGLLELFKRIFVIDPVKRISFQELYDMEIFSDYFSPNELRQSSLIYYEVQKKTPLMGSMEDAKNDDEGSDLPKEEMNKTKTSKFKPSSKASEAQFQSINNIFNTQNETNNNNQTNSSKATFNNNLSNNQIIYEAENQNFVYDNNKINQSTIYNKNSMNRSVATAYNYEYKEVKLNISSHITQTQGCNESQFDHEDLEVNNDESPQIQLKNIQMFQNGNNHYFGPKAFQDQDILPISKAKKEDEDTSIPNAPSSFQCNNFSHNSFNHAAQQIENMNNFSKQSTQNSKNGGQFASKYSQGQTINVTEEDEEDDSKGSDDEGKEFEKKTQPISFREKDDLSNESVLKNAPVRKSPSLHMSMVDKAVKDKLRKKIIDECEAMFENHVQIYLYEIGTYNILGDTIDSLNVLNLGSSTQSLINYLLSKLLLFYANRALNSLQQVNNIFNLQYFNQFAQSPCSQLIKGKITRDIEQWSMKFSLFYYGIDYDQDIQSEEVRKVVTEELIETDFDTQLKIPIRLVLDLIFKASYKMGKSCTSSLQASAILRTTLYILLSMLINNVFDKTKVKEYLIYYFEDPSNQGATHLDFVNFSLWTAQASKEILLDQIHHLIKVVFGEKKLLIFQTRM